MGGLFQQAGRILQLRKELAKAQQRQGAGGRSSSPSRANGGGAGGVYYNGGVTFSTQGPGDNSNTTVRRPYRDEMLLRDLAEKDYHLAGQLGE